MIRPSLASTLVALVLLASGAACQRGPVTFELHGKPNYFGGPVTIEIDDGSGSEPERFEVEAAKLDGYTFESKSVIVGERWNIWVDGPAGDGCNRTSAEASGTANKTTVSVTLDEYVTTELDCSGLP